MNKAELLSDLTGKFYKLGNVALVELSPADNTIRDAEGVKWYLAGLYEKTADSRMIRRNVSFYVEDEGKAGEAAFYAEKLPVDSLPVKPESGFMDLVVAEIGKMITAGTILKGVTESIDESSEFSVVKAYQVITGEVVVKRYFAYVDVESKLQFAIMKDI